MKLRPFLVIAHRGDSAHAPENTLPAFDAAVRAGADELECDVHVTKDGVAVLSHDPNLKRATGINRLVGELAFEEVRRLDAGRWKGRAFAGTRIPSLQEFLQLYLPLLPLEIELKTAAAARPALSLLRDFGRDAFERVLLIGFEHRDLAAARRIEPRARIAPILARGAHIAPRDLKDLGAACIIPHAADVTPGLVEESHGLGMAVRAWGVGNLRAAQRVRDAGADGATYDDPGKLTAYLKENAH